MFSKNVSLPFFFLSFCMSVCLFIYLSISLSFPFLLIHWFSLFLHSILLFYLTRFSCLIILCILSPFLYFFYLSLFISLPVFTIFQNLFLSTFFANIYFSSNYVLQICKTPYLFSYFLYVCLSLLYFSVKGLKNKFTIPKGYQKSIYQVFNDVFFEEFLLSRQLQPIFIFY